MDISTFELERRQSIWENQVEYNLTESGIDPLSLSELLTEYEQEQVLNIELGYGQTNGDFQLRKNIARIYQKPDWDQENVLVTNGSSEANLLAVYSWLEPGDEMIFMMPNYQQMNGFAESLGIEVKNWWAKESNQWLPRIEDLKSLINDRTRLIAICNPNNPTGRVLPESMITAIVELAEEHDLIIYADEVYRGAEYSGEETYSLTEYSDRAIVCGGLSKAYSLPGLRLGWLAGPEKRITQAWRHRDYTTIASGLLSQYIADKALQPDRRAWILNRNRKLLRENLKFFKDWCRQQKANFHFIDPEAGGIVWVRYDKSVNSTALTRSLREEESVFLVAGDCFGQDQHLRIGIGAESEHLKEALNRFSRWIDSNW